MKIAYVIHWNEGPQSGVFKKAASQISEWTRLGHQVGLFLFTGGTGEEWAEELESAGVEVVAQSYQGGLSRMLDFRKLARQVRRWKPDVIYHRFDHYYYALPGLLRDFPSVLEINSNDLTEMRMDKDLRYVVHRLTRALVLRAAWGNVFVSRELSGVPEFSRYARHSIIIGNGICLDDELVGHSPSSKPPELSLSTQTDAIQLVFIGSPGQAWHGVDAIAELAWARPGWSFDIIGVDASELAEPAPANMIFHGRLVREQYQPLLERADLAIGTLALHRKRMEEASPLKVREYLANGLPVITAYEETDFRGPVPFILQLPNRPGNVRDGLAEIDAFASAWKGKKVPRKSISHLDARVKEAQRLGYMELIRDKGERT
ncbi:glycosyltransferase [Paenibacillus sp. YPG26]|uniref:glycosyltransferase n=1 Tax=Paenibacillus sp. YPG26 TaxID=2878915 RepID=UPI00203BE417|nr:glycosyltransferase [Paenibacillus sp. YPG26]USB33027.1 glycosyltransferase [Paenibacillus sp. YPG26]